MRQKAEAVAMKKEEKEKALEETRKDQEDEDPRLRS